MASSLEPPPSVPATSMEAPSGVKVILRKPCPPLGLVLIVGTCLDVTGLPPALRLCTTDGVLSPPLPPTASNDPLGLIVMEVGVDSPAVRARKNLGVCDALEI